MKNKVVSYIRYVGSKRKFVNIINNELLKINEPSVYIEPFLGSGAVFLNLPENFNNSKKVLVEINENLCKIWLALKNANFSDFEKFWNENESRFGKWGSNKESFYAMRNFNNERLFNSNTLEEGIFYYIISRSCINGLCRWGKKGFNSAFGNRGRSLNFNEQEFLLLKNKLSQVSVKHSNFFTIYDEYINDEKAVWFLDPPYISTNIGGEYRSNFNHQLFLQIIKKIKGKVIYTDLYSDDVYNALNWRVVELQDLKSIRPSGSRKVSIGKEVMYINF